MFREEGAREVFREFEEGAREVFREEGAIGRCSGKRELGRCSGKREL